MSQTTTVIEACAIFYLNQTSGACAGVCACNHMHQMEKTEEQVQDLNAFCWKVSA